MADNADELIKELKQETENSNIGKNPAPADTASEEQRSDADHGTTHFDEPASNQETAAIDPDFTPGAAKGIAIRYLKMFSNFMKLAFTPLYKKTILEKDDIKKMTDFRSQHTGKSEKQMDDALHSDHAMWPVVNRFDRYMKAVNDLPLDEAEIDMIATPLSELIVKYKAMRLSPEAMFFIAVGMTMLPRLTHLIPDLNKAAESKEK